MVLSFVCYFGGVFGVWVHVFLWQCGGCLFGSLGCLVVGGCAVRRRFVWFGALVRVVGGWWVFNYWAKTVWMMCWFSGELLCGLHLWRRVGLWGCGVVLYCRGCCCTG